MMGGVRFDGSVANGYEVVVDTLGGCGPGWRWPRFVGGRRVVDLWTADLSENSLVCTRSAVKPVVGACLLLADRGRIDHVVATWPELDDDRLLIRHLLTHTAGRATSPEPSGPARRVALKIEHGWAPSSRSRGTESNTTSPTVGP